MPELYGDFPPQTATTIDTWYIRCAHCKRFRIYVSYYAQKRPLYCLGCLYGVG